MPSPLTKERVVEAALAVLDSEGIDGLTLRAVAGRLEVKAPALYWHFRDKQELLDEMGTEIWRRIAADLAALPPDLPWEAGLREFAAITRRRLLSHRDGAKVFTGTHLTDYRVLRGQEGGYRQLVERDGFAVPDVARAVALLHHFVIGFCVEEQAMTQNAERYSLERRTEELDATPHLAASGEQVLGDPDVRFADQLAILLDAIGRLRTH